MTFDFDAFGNPVKQVNGKARPTAMDAPELYCDGVYDPALAFYYQPIQPHSQPVGLFTSLEITPARSTTRRAWRSSCTPATPPLTASIRRNGTVVPDFFLRRCAPTNTLPVVPVAPSRRRRPSRKSAALGADAGAMEWKGR
jgi:hypothetical protein